MPDHVTRLYPTPQSDIALEGLYLSHALHRLSSRQRPLVYTNFIASLDGRIAIEHPSTGKHKVPDAITNPRDWRLYQELAAQSDVLIASARYLRELSINAAQDSLPLSDDPAYADLHAWRRQQGLAPQPAVVILSASLDLPLAGLCEKLKRPVYVATGDAVSTASRKTIEQSGAKILTAGQGRKVDGRQLVEQLAAEGFRSIYSIAGPGVLETLLEARVLDRLYLTQVHRLLGGRSYDTLLAGSKLDPPADFSLQALYYDPVHEHSEKHPCGQFFGVYDVPSLQLDK